MKTGRKAGTKTVTFKFIADRYAIKMKRNKNEKILLHRVEYGSNELAGQMYSTRAGACDIDCHIYSVEIKKKHSELLENATFMEYIVSTREDFHKVPYKYRKYIVICRSGMYISGLFKVDHE